MPNILNERQFTVDVDFITGHDHTQPGRHRVSVLAKSGDEANLVAAQMVAATGDRMPTQTRLHV